MRKESLKQMESVIFGAGYWGKVLKRGLEKFCGVHICAIFDNDESKWGEKIDNVIISSPQKLIDMNFEKIFVCIWGKDNYSEIETQLVNMGIPREKIEIMRTSKKYIEAFIEAYIKDEFLKINWIKAFSRYTKEIGMRGSVAECGVLYGNTAMFINNYWPDRTLHLFDTFEGFHEKDIAYDSESFPAFKNGYFATNPFKINKPESIIDEVKDKMRYPDNLKIHKGYFPESAGIIEDKFCFVNLDMDLYQPQLEGLRYFWSKMEPGGIILLHDYYHPELPGVKKAVTDFEKELGEMLLKFPIGDDCSIAVIKP